MSKKGRTMKPWIKSKSFWVGILQLIAALTLFGNQFLTDHEITFDDPTKLLLLGNGLVMVILRWLTDQPITSFFKSADKLRPRIKMNDEARRYRI